MTKIKDNCVLITGGASGIGRIMGRMVLEKGARCLVIWDINQASIDSTIAEFSSLGNVKGYRVDVSDSEQVVKTAAVTGKECGNVDILINCAGIVANNETFDKQSIRDIERTMEINATAPMVIAQQFPEADFPEEGILGGHMAAGKDDEIAFPDEQPGFILVSPVQLVKLRKSQPCLIEAGGHFLRHPVGESGVIRCCCDKEALGMFRQTPAQILLKSVLRVQDRPGCPINTGAAG